MDLFEKRTMSVYDVRTGPVPGVKNAKTLKGGRIITSRGRAGRRKTDLSDIAARMGLITWMLSLLNKNDNTCVSSRGWKKSRTLTETTLDRWSRMFRVLVDRRGLLTIRVVFYLSDRRTRDADNMMSAVLDCLKKARIIEDDSINHIGEQSHTHRQVSKGREGFRATIIK